MDGYIEDDSLVLKDRSNVFVVFVVVPDVSPDILIITLFIQFLPKVFKI